ARSSARVVSSLSLQVAVTDAGLKTGMPQCSSTESTARPRDWLTLRQRTASYPDHRSSGQVRSSNKSPSSITSKATVRRFSASINSFSSTRIREVRIAKRIVSFSPIFLDLRSEGHARLFYTQHL